MEGPRGFIRVFPPFQPESLSTDDLLSTARKINLRSQEIYKLVGTEFFGS